MKTLLPSSSTSFCINVVGQSNIMIYESINNYVVFSLIHILSLTRHHQKATRTGMRRQPPVTTPAAIPG